MNVLEICDYAANYPGNFIPSISLLADVLKQKGHDIYFFFPNRNLTNDFYLWEKEFANKYSVNLCDFSNLNIIKKIVSFIKEKNINIVHTHFFPSFFLSMMKKNCSKDVKFFEHIHSAIYENKKTFKARIKRIRNLFILNHNITKICVSYSLVNMTKFIYPLSKVVVCRNAINLERLKENNSISLDNFKILIFGYNYHIKGIDIAIEAFLKLRKNIDCVLDIVFASNFDSNRDIILKKYGKIPHGINLLKPSQNVSDLYKTHQVFLSASRSEGFAYSILEAYYSGCCCVSSDLPAVVMNNLPGIIYFKNGNVNDLTDALKTAYLKRFEYKNDTNYIKKEFSLEVWCSQMIKIFDLNINK